MSLAQARERDRVSITGAAVSKMYTGDRTIDGVEVSVDGASLNERRDVKSYTDNGFEWSYEGDGPRQLSLALLADHLGDGNEALRRTEAFMEAVVANFGNEWSMTSDDIDRALANIGASA